MERRGGTRRRFDPPSYRDDKRTVLQRVDAMAEIMQMRTTFNIKAADGIAMKSEILHTVNAVSSTKGEPMVARYPARGPTTSLR